MGYVVTTPVFEGPIDLLLHLVSTHELDVLDVPLAPVVDGFVAELSRQAGACPMEVLSEFLLVAAILVELKSQRLLPGADEPETDEEVVAWEERDLLLARLLECRAYAGVADCFVAMIEAASRSLPREAGLDEGFAVHAPDLLEGVSAQQVAQAYLRATALRPAPQVDLSHVTVETVSVSETVQALTGILPAQGAVWFREITRGLATRMEVIVHFLAVLELCKRGSVLLGQGETFGDLRITWVANRVTMAGAPLAGAAMVGALVGGEMGAGDPTGDESDEYDG
ncbi:MAG: ScpA family protein [Actinomycetota bacterium]|nr:ScpA family protein [Actinomycetota bacterium]